MKQYYSIKAKYPDAVLLFRVGDFYETFGEDAIRAADILGIVLTRRANGAASYVELAGFPHHALDTYLPKLVRAGQRVAICEQLEDPKLTKTIVKRGVTELVTPGIAFSDKVLDHKENNYLSALHFADQQIGVSFLDVSTGEFLAEQGPPEQIDLLLQSFRPSEILVQKANVRRLQTLFPGKYHLTPMEDWVFTRDFADDLLLKHFGVRSLKGFGLELYNEGIIACGAAMQYLSQSRSEIPAHIRKISRVDQKNHVWLDRFTIRNLELIHSVNEGAVTLIQVLDQTQTPMGSRMLKRWVLLPLRDRQAIEKRHEVVSCFVDAPELAETIKGHLRSIHDLERLISRANVEKINPREVLQLKRALEAIVPVQSVCMESGSEVLSDAVAGLDPCRDLIDRIRSVIVEDPPALVTKGGVIADGINPELDELRKIAYSGKDYLADLRLREIERTGIPSIKISFNNVFGYYLEVTNTHKDKVPDDWQRKQTLANAERYITPELKLYEEKILSAEEKILAIEQEVYQSLIRDVISYTAPIQQNAVIIARLDCLLCFASLAVKFKYTKPQINES